MIISLLGSPRNIQGRNNPASLVVKPEQVVRDIHPPDCCAEGEPLLQDEVHDVLQAGHGNAVQPVHIKYPADPNPTTRSPTLLPPDLSNPTTRSPTFLPPDLILQPDPEHLGQESVCTNFMNPSNYFTLVKVSGSVAQCIQFTNWQIAVTNATQIRVSCVQHKVIYTRPSLVLLV